MVDVTRRQPLIKVIITNVIIGPKSNGIEALLQLTFPQEDGQSDLGGLVLLMEVHDSKASVSHNRSLYFLVSFLESK